MRTLIFDTQPNVISQDYVYWLLEQWRHEKQDLEDEVYYVLLLFQKENFELRSQFTKENLRELAIDVDDPIQYAQVATPYLRQLVRKSIAKLDKDIETMVMSLLLEPNVTAVDQLLADDDTSEQATGQLMTVYRTENTQMRSDYVELITGIVMGQGFQLKRQWVHTLSNPNVHVGKGYVPRDDHVALDGVLEDANGMFTTPGGNSTHAPGEFGIASEDINCRCDVVFVSG